MRPVNINELLNKKKNHRIQHVNQQGQAQGAHSPVSVTCNK